MADTERRIGFIPNPGCQEDADAVVEKTMSLYRDNFINEVCLVRGFLCRQVLLEAGFPRDKITVLQCFRKKDDPIKALMSHLMTLPKRLILLRVVAVSYHCPRYADKLRRAQMLEEAKDRNLAPILLVGCCEVYSKRIDWWYPIHFFQMCCRVLKDLLNPLSWQSTD